MSAAPATVRAPFPSCFRQRVLLLCGARGAGKDTLADELIAVLEADGYTCLRMSLAKPLKDLTARMLSIMRPYTLQYDTVRAQMDTQDGKLMTPLAPGVTNRDLLVGLGIAARQTFGHDFWVNQAVQSAASSRAHFIIVTDVRFANEITGFRQGLAPDAVIMHLGVIRPGQASQGPDDDAALQTNIQATDSGESSHGRGVLYVPMVNDGTLESWRQKSCALAKELVPTATPAAAADQDE